MVSHENRNYEVGGDIVTNGLKPKRPNPVAPWEDFHPLEKKQTQRADSEMTPFTQSSDSLPEFFEDDWMELLHLTWPYQDKMGSQPTGAFQQDEGTQPMDAFQEDEGTQPTDAAEKYEETQV